MTDTISGADAPAQPSSGEQPSSSNNIVADEPSLRQITQSTLVHLLGHNGYASLKARNWTLIGLLAPVLGVVSDVLQVFGAVALTLAIVTGGTFFLLLVAILFRSRYCRHCAFPCVVAFVCLVVIGSVAFLQ